ncbi:hypothetical protein R3P38DRAFT_2416715, partial [Favolaschia claudopus]
LAPDYLIQLACEEWDRIEAEKKKRNGNTQPNREDTGTALSAQYFSSSSQSNRSGKFGKGNNQRPKGVCWNCGGKGHVQSKCPSPKPNRGEKGGGNGKPNASAGSANAVDDDDGAWCVESIDLDEVTKT